MKFALIKKGRKRVHCSAPLGVTDAPARTINLIDNGELVGVHVLAAVGREDADALTRPAADEASARASAAAADASCGGGYDAIAWGPRSLLPRSRPHSATAVAGGHLVWGYGPLCSPV